MRINKLKKKYYNKSVLDINGFKFVDKGVLGIVGKNGVGKTTLLKCLSGHLISDHKEIQIGKISFFPNNTGFIGNSITDLINLMRLSYSDFVEEKFKDLLTKNKLDEKMVISSLSRGQKVLLNIILTLSRNTEVYFLDEPYSNMDFITTEKVTELLIEACDTSDKVLVITSHQFSDIERLLDYITIIKDKNMQDPVTVNDITNNQSLVRWFKENVEGNYEKVL